MVNVFSENNTTSDTYPSEAPNCDYELPDFNIDSIVDIPNVGDTVANDFILILDENIKEVTASNNDGNLPANAVDGDLDTRWSAFGEGEYLLIEFEKLSNVSSMGIDFLNSESRRSFLRLNTRKMETIT